MATDLKSMMDKLIEKEKRAEEIKEQAKQFLAAHELYILAGAARSATFLEFTGGTWVKTADSNFDIHHRQFKTKDAYEALIDELASQGRTFKRHTYTFSTVPKDTINLVRTDAFIAPLDDGMMHNALFDVLVKSLANGDPQKAEYLEHIVAWKYLNLGAVCQQSIIFYGEGGAGKNLFVDIVLHKMFGGLTVSGLWDDLMARDWNDHLAGKVCVMLNEVPRNKPDMNKLKNDVGKLRIPIHERYLSSTEVDNYALWIIASNDPNGPITLGRDKSDRRWVVFHIDHNLNHWLNEDLQLGLGDMENLPDAVLDVFKDEKQIGRWLHYLIQKHGSKPAPGYFETDDFKEMKDDQKQVWEELFEEVFKQDKTARRVLCRDLYTNYRHRMDEEYPDGVRLGPNSLASRAKAWNTQHKTGWTKRQSIRVGKEVVKGFVRDVPESSGDDGSAEADTLTSAFAALKKRADGLK